jgi:hypothetical protein
MSIEVALDDLGEAIGRRTGQAYLVSVRPTDGGFRPHVVSVTPRRDDDGTIAVGAGRRTGRNVGDHPEVTLLWPVDDGDPTHSLLVDGTAVASPDGEELVVTPTSAILHRVRASR